MMSPIVHFEIPADDVQRAKVFYENVFGWKIEKFGEGADEYWMVYSTEVGKDKKPVKPGAINGGMMKRKFPEQQFMNYISVSSVDKALKDVEAGGGKVAMPKQEIGEGMGWIAAFKDTEGNLMGLHEMGKDGEM